MICRTDRYAPSTLLNRTSVPTVLYRYYDLSLYSPEEPDVKPLDMHTYPIEWPTNMPASFNMRAYSVLGMGVIMLASNSR